MILTHHAETRMQQRGIPFLAVELLCNFGSAEYVGDAKIRYFDKKSLKKAKHQIKQMMEQVDRIEKMYCVESDEGVVVTTGHLTKHIMRDYKNHNQTNINR